MQHESEAGAGGVRRLAMWSGPRNISTAMLRAWENRADTVVCDEPFYAFYLDRTGKDHPGREEILATCEADPAGVVAGLLGPVPEGVGVFYQKHMAHHLLEELERGFLNGLQHGFLLREPAAMLLSLSRVTPEPRLVDTGLPQQLEIFRHVRDTTGTTPPVLDSHDVLSDPARALGALCEAWGVAFDRAMLSWPPGRRDSDGVWAKHWYGSVEESTGFRSPPAPRSPDDLPAALVAVYEACLPIYAELSAERLLD